jgi:SAM-dependent methyltransferase
MLDLIRSLPPGSRVLDLGAGSGSFPAAVAGIHVYRLEPEPPAQRAEGNYVAASASRMPFRDAAFDVVISNHSLEHIADLDGALAEVGRVTRPRGSLYVAVPDAGTLTDRIYRWLGKGGGHVNPFHSAAELAARIERHTGLRHRGTRTLFSGLSFLNAHNFVAKPPRKIALFAWGNERFLAVFVWVLRALDQRFGTRLSHYGWSFYFGAAAVPHAAEEWINVCVRCGAGASETWLRKQGAIPPLPQMWNWYRCPGCGGLNLLTPE